MHKVTVCLAICFAVLLTSACETTPPRLVVGIDASRDAGADAYQAPSDGGMDDLGQDSSIVVVFDAMIMDANMADAGSDASVTDSGSDAGSFDAGYDAGYDAGPPFPLGQCNPGYPESYAPGCDCFCYTSTIETSTCQNASAARCHTQTDVDAGVRKNYCYTDPDAGALVSRCGWSLATPLPVDYLACESELLGRNWSVYSSSIATGESCVAVYERLNGQNYYSLRCTGNPSVSNHELGWLPNMQCGVNNGLGCIANGANADLYTANATTRDGYKYTVTFNTLCTQATVRAVDPITQAFLWFVIIK